MSDIQYNPAISRREIAHKTVKSINNLYRFNEDCTDLEFLMGDYKGLKLTELWVKGSKERDFIFSKLYKSNPKVKKIIDNLCCQE
jgi:hypothetical protein